MHPKQTSIFNPQGFSLPLQALALAITAGVAVFWVYLGLVPISLDFAGIYMVVLFSGMFYSLITFNKNVGALVGLAAVVLIVLAFLTTAPMFHAGRYEALLGKEVDTDFNKTLPPIDIEQAPLVSEDMAMQAMQKRLSEVSAVGSQVRVSRPVKQLVKGKLVWVAFLEHSGFFKWFNDGSTPGYLVVSAHDPSDVQLVQELKGEKLKMRYLNSAYFGDNVERHAYNSGLSTVGMTDFEPEIDDEGNPYYIGTTFRTTIGISGHDATGVVAVNAVTGDVKSYTIANMPSWIDRVQPEEFILEQMRDRGEYVQGWFNPSDAGRMRVDGDLDLVYGSDGKPYWVGGMTSTGKNNGLSGFYFVDSRTKAVHYLKAPSVSQATAAHGVENVNPEKHYSATNPLPFLVDGVPTYVMALRDSQGVSRAFGMVDMRNNQIIGVADTLAATLRSYQSKRSANPNNADISTEAKKLNVEATVVRIASEYRNNQTMYYVTLRAKNVVMPNIFTGSSDLSEELVLTKPGDTVQIQYAESTSRVVGMSKFDNKDIPEVMTPVATPAQ